MTHAYFSISLGINAILYFLAFIYYDTWWTPIPSDSFIGDPIQLKSSGNIRDLFIVLLQVFLSECPRGIVLASITPYLAFISTAAESQSLIGYAVSLFSLGRLASSLPYGYMVDWTRSSRNTLILATIITMFGSVLYMMGAWIGSGSYAVACVLISRFIIGFGSGTLSVSRSFMISISTSEERTKYVSWNTLVQYIGFSMSPIFPVVINWIFPSDASKWQQDLVYNPSFFIIGANMVMLMLLFSSMSKHDPKLPEVRDSMRSLNIQDTNWNGGLSKLDAGFALFIFLNFSLRGVVGVVETIGASEYQRLNSADPDNVEDSMWFLLTMGAAGIMTFLALGYLEKIFSAFTLLLFGMGAMISGSIALLPWLSHDSEILMILGTSLIWCFGSPITQVFTISTYSQLMGQRPQGAIMGWLTTSGSVGRIVLPLLSSISHSLAHGTDIITVTFSIIVVLIFIGRYGKSTKPER
uniref:Major facilitator superfamily (MFS) profile domain-containing protein n=1 Tax=Spongospora subterranea TaxID=70186 RepID=A0A0H5QTA4_9EUKA|eukprot:CRZ05233.1 hypothetical protein [Spongospora subterranea]